MSTSSVSGFDSFKKVQFDFVSWAANWLKNDIQIEPATFDLPDIVNLLQAVGFKIRRIDASNDPSLLRGGENGSRVVISCTHSGQRCVMEEPLPKVHCKCTKTVLDNDDANKDGFWEVISSTPGSRQSLIETGCDLIPPLSRDHSSLIKTVLSYLLKVIREKETSASIDNLMSTPVRAGRRSAPLTSSSAINSPHRNSLGSVGVAVRPDVNLSPKKGLDSPARYRSLDTLTAKDADIGLPEPGSLVPKICVLRPETQSSPSLRIRLEAQESVSSLSSMEMTAKATSLIKSASENLLKAIALIESDKRAASPNSVFEEKILSASKNIKKLICTSKPSSKSETTLANPKVTVAPKLKKRIIHRSTESYTLSAKPATVKTSKPKATSGSIIPKPEGVVRRPEKFSHIKSTIPKFETKKK